MQTQQIQLKNNQWLTNIASADFDAAKSQLAIVFGSGELASNPTNFDTLRSKFPNAAIVTCSTAGEIIGEEVYDDTLIATAIQFEKATVRCINTSIGEHANSFETGQFLFNSLNADDLTGIFIISDGT